MPPAVSKLVTIYLFIVQLPCNDGEEGGGVGEEPLLWQAANKRTATKNELDPVSIFFFIGITVFFINITSDI
jgi:hypothetical protein